MIERDDKKQTFALSTMEIIVCLTFKSKDDKGKCAHIVSSLLLSAIL